MTDAPTVDQLPAGAPTHMLRHRQSVISRGTVARSVGTRSRLVNPAAYDRLPDPPHTPKPTTSAKPLPNPSVDFDPTGVSAEPVFRSAKRGRVEKRPIHRSNGSTSEPPARRESLRDTFDRLAPEELRNKPKPQTLDGSVVPVTETADWYVPMKRESPAMAARRQRIRQCLDFYYNRPLNTAEDSSWSMMHIMMAWGRDSKIYVGPPGGRVVSTIGWMCANGTCDGNRLLYVHDGEIRAKVGPGVQGHRAQFLAMLAQARVHLDQPIRVGDKEFTVRDLLRQEQSACVPRSELTFALIGSAHYLHTDTKWENGRGQEWSIPRLMYEEMRQPINGVTCGGTHRLMGLSYAIRRREADGYAINGIYEKARRFTKTYQDKALAWQNGDGSFNSDFWRSRGNWGDMSRKLKTSGHILEWLVFSLPHEELDSPRVVRGVDYLTHLMTQNRYYDWENGPMAHAIRALSLYDERVFGGEQGQRTLRTASNPPTVSRSREQVSRVNSRSNSRPRYPRLRAGAR
ncbi:MAG: hypothetical protein AAGA95_20040 [Pseudomonadota bacterium]